MTPEQAEIVAVMALDYAAWNGKMLELHNKGYTPEQICDALNALYRLAGRPADQDLTECSPRD